MYLLDDRFSTMVAFVEGFSTAVGGSPLSGFQDWVCERILGTRSSIHWAYVIASTRVPDILDGKRPIDRIPHEVEADLADLALDLVEEFSNRPAG
ncbi:hypothetical protein [Streptomyces sasae]|uniref:hypothetical protein n=1 Tax=Streptomyces sasae TaxID=1266772 RepID=UPI00292EED4D|nr:hypothetical protein [Streptomyces sasae]